MLKYPLYPTRLSLDHVDAMVEALALKRLSKEGLLDVLTHAGDSLTK